MTVAFVDTSGLPVPDVEIRIGRASGVVFEGRTGADGRSAPIPRSSIESGASLLASHHDYQPISDVLDDHVLEERVYVLSRGAVLRGVIVHPDGSPVDGRPNVLCYPVGRTPSKSELTRALVGSTASVHVARADLDGGFELLGLEPETDYEIQVGGGGCVLETPGRARSDTEGLLLEVSAVFAARLRLEGVPIADDMPWSHPGPQWFWDPAGIGARGLATDSLAALLVGFQERETTRLPGNPVTMAFVGPFGSDSVGPISLNAALAGYRPIDRQLWIPRARDEIPEVVIPLESLVEGRGTVDVRFVGQLAGSRGVERVAPLGKVRFRSSSGDTSFERLLTELSEEPVRVTHVPFGSYEVTLSTESGYLAYPCAEVRIHLTPADAQADVTFDLGVACEIEIHATMRDSAEVVSELTVEVAQELDDDTHTSYVSFRRAPYVVQGLIPGRYSLTISRPFFDPEPISTTLTRDERRQAIAFLQR